MVLETLFIMCVAGLDFLEKLFCPKNGQNGFRQSDSRIFESTISPEQDDETA